MKHRRRLGGFAGLKSAHGERQRRRWADPLVTVASKNDLASEGMADDDKSNGISCRQTLLPADPEETAENKEETLAQLLKRHLRNLVHFFVEDWFISGMLGFITAALSISVDVGYEYLNHYRAILFDFARDYDVMLGFVSWVGFLVVFVGAAALVCKYVSAQAIGSGIPEVKVIMNGFMLQNYLSFRTLVAKMLSLTLTLGSGLPVGKEPRMFVIGQINGVNDVFAFVTDVNGKEFRVPRELIREPMFGNYYQFDGTFLESDVLEPTSVTALANDSKALLDARAKLWDEKFGNDKCTLQKIKEMGIDSLVKKIFDSSVSEEAMEENETEQKANDNVKLHVEVKRSGRKSKNGAEIYCADNFPLVIDSSGLLNRFLEEEPIIRHAPDRKFGVCCAPRKYPIDGINWKIVRVDPESKPKKALPNGVSKMNGHSKKSVSNGGQTDECNSNSPSTYSSLPSTTVRNSPKLEEEEEKVDENELFEGLICSQNETHFLVFSPGRRWLGRLDKAKCGKDSASILGMWIQFKIKNKAGMKFVDTRFNFTRQKIIATPTGDYVLIRCRLSVPPFHEVSETPWCEELRTNVIDKAEILKQEHHGKTVLAVIGCPSQVVDEDSYILKWQLLSVVD